MLLCEAFEAFGVLGNAPAPAAAGKRNGIVSALLIPVLAGAAVLSYTIAPELSGDLQLTITLFYVPAILYLAAACKPVRVLLECPPLVALGRISMPVFFLHMPLRELHNAWLDPWFVSLGVPNGPRLLLYLLMLLLCGAAGYFLSGWLRRRKRNNPDETGESPERPDRISGTR